LQAGQWTTPPGDPAKSIGVLAGHGQIITAVKSDPSIRGAFKSMITAILLYPYEMDIYACYRLLLFRVFGLLSRHHTTAIHKVVLRASQHRKLILRICDTVHRMPDCQSRNEVQHTPMWAALVARLVLEPSKRQAGHHRDYDIAACPDLR